MWIFGNYIFEEGRILEQSGCEYYVIPLIFSLKENINFSVREIGEAFFPIILCGDSFLFHYFMCWCLTSFKVATKNGDPNLGKRSCGNEIIPIISCDILL